MARTGSRQDAVVSYSCNIERGDVSARLGMLAACAAVFPGAEVAEH